MFGKSVFQTVLERLEADGQEADRDAPPIAVRGLNAGFAQDTAGMAIAGGTDVWQAYAETGGTAPPVTEPPPVVAAEPKPAEHPARLHRLTPAEILDDLALAVTDTAVTLMEKRRIFAADNHPDRHPPALRQAATTRMTIANMMVDDALQRLKRGLPPIASATPRPSTPQAPSPKSRSAGPHREEPRPQHRR